MSTDEEAENHLLLVNTFFVSCGQRMLEIFLSTFWGWLVSDIKIVSRGTKTGQNKQQSSVQPVVLWDGQGSGNYELGQDYLVWNHYKNCGCLIYTYRNRLAISHTILAAVAERAAPPASSPYFRATGGFSFSFFRATQNCEQI